MTPEELGCPQSREEMYLRAIAENDTRYLPYKPLSREEMYLEYIALNGGGGSGAVVTVTGDSGTLTAAQITDVLKDNTIIENDGQMFYLSNKMSTLTYRTYINVDTATSELDVHAIYVQLNEEAVNYGHWTKEQIPDGDASWGNITGTLDSQTDLKNALDAKQGTLTAGTNITIDANNVISAQGGTTIEQSIGTSTTSVMSQNATTEAVKDNILTINNLASTFAYNTTDTNTQNWLKTLLNSVVNGLPYRSMICENTNLYTYNFVEKVIDASVTSNYVKFEIQIHPVASSLDKSIRTYYGVKYIEATVVKVEAYVRRAEYDNKAITHVYSTPSFSNGSLTKTTKTNYLIVDDLYNNAPIGTVNTTAYTPTSDYHPATKKYADDTVASEATQRQNGDNALSQWCTALESSIPAQGSIASGNTGYVTGGDVYTAIGNVESAINTIRGV